MICPKCEGYTVKCTRIYGEGGWYRRADFEDCTECDGTGKVEESK